MADDKSYISAEEVLDLLDKVPLNANQLRQCLRPAAQYFHKSMVGAVGKGWGIRTGRMHAEGVKIQTSSKTKGENSAGYRIYFSKKSSRVRGTKDYIAPTYVARWLEGGTKPHYTVRGATTKKANRGSLTLNRYQRRLKHPGFAARPIVESEQKGQEERVSGMVRVNILNMLKRKGVFK